MNKENLYQSFEFTLLDSPDFKEDSVREELILPMLKTLGYSATGENKIIRSKAVSHPFVQTGSGKHQLTSIPDYLLEVSAKYAWVLDAKAPKSFYCFSTIVKAMRFQRKTSVCFR